MHNPKETLGTSKFHNPSFWEKNIYRIIHFFFCYLQEYIHNDIVEYKNTRHKTLGIVISYVLMFDWKNTIFRANFQFLTINYYLHKNN